LLHRPLGRHLNQRFFVFDILSSAHLSGDVLHDHADFSGKDLLAVDLEDRGIFVSGLLGRRLCDDGHRRDQGCNKNKSEFDMSFHCGPFHFGTGLKARSTKAQHIIN
jgi:hypothetical protein